MIDITMYNELSQNDVDNFILTIDKTLIPTNDYDVRVWDKTSMFGLDTNTLIKKYGNDFYILYINGRPCSIVYNNDISWYKEQDINTKIDEIVSEHFKDKLKSNIQPVPEYQPTNAEIYKQQLDQAEMMLDQQLLMLEIKLNTGI